jgi:hypothetical protein
MLEVKNNQLFERVEKRFSTDFFHRFCGKLSSEKVRGIKSERGNGKKLNQIEVQRFFSF